MKVFVVQAYRYSCFDNHSYIAGVYSDLKTAKEMAKKEEDFRGGKYGCIVYGMELDKNDMQQKISSYQTDFFIEENLKTYKMRKENSKEMRDGEPDDW